MPLLASSPRDRLFDEGWRFFRGERPGAEAPSYDDSEWRELDLPHDWSIEDLPPKQRSVLQLEAVTGQWRFRRGDDASWKEPKLDDNDWQQVNLPAAWEQHSRYQDDYAYGWYRRQINVPAECAGREFDLLLGRIDDVDEVWLNGERIGGSGSFPPDYRTAWDTERRYRVPASLARGDGSDTVAVRVFDGENSGGLLATGTSGERIGPFDPQDSKGQDKTGYVLGGTGWYRKHFKMSESGKRVAMRFDGVYMNADVWINGQHICFHPYGYTSFECDLTPHLKPAGEENTLAVRVRNEGRNSRWYSGSGIYRHVWLSITDRLHLPTWGLFVTTPEVTDEQAVANLRMEAKNERAKTATFALVASVRDIHGQTMGMAKAELTLDAGETQTVDRSITITSPKRWSIESPHLYIAKVEVVVDGSTVDADETKFGIRTLSIDAERGFQLNGEPTLLKGGCVHHDNGPLGAAAIDRAEERKVELLKANGYNALRTSHNPPSPALLDACDRQGMLVVDEAFDQWNEQKLDNAEDYHRYFSQWHERDIASMVRRDRNHPSVIMWSIGNEIPEQFRAEHTQLALRKAVLEHDDTRAITQAICTDWGTVIQNWDELSDPAFTHLDVAGYNYLPEKYESDHGRHPDRVMYGSESYPKDAFDYWSLAEKHPYVIGDFVWTAIDYLGESGIAHMVLSNEPNPFFMSWPWHNAWCGDLDICGFKKPQSYYRDVVWRESPIEMAVHTPVPEGLNEVLSWWAWPDEQQSWNWEGHEGEPLEVSVYTRCDAVRLELNGQVIGEQPVSEDTKLTAKFQVPYAAGELCALGIYDGEVITKTKLTTSGSPKRIKLTPDRTTVSTDRNDLCYVSVEVVDAKGQWVPDAAIPVQFLVEGVGELAGQASGAPNKPASFRAAECLTYQGRCLVVLRPMGGAGEISLSAKSPGVRTASTDIDSTDSSVAGARGTATPAIGRKAYDQQ